MSAQPLPSEVFRAGDDAVIAIDDAKSPHVQAGVACWRAQCGDRRFPARADMTLRGMAAILPHSVIVAVVDDGADYEYRYVGEAQRQAFGTYFKGMRISQIEAAAPALGALLRGAYDMVRLSGMPFVARGRAGEDLPESKALYHETAFLPLGTNDVTDHILVVGVQVPAPFWDIPKKQIQELAR